MHCFEAAAAGLNTSITGCVQKPKSTEDGEDVQSSSLVAICISGCGIAFLMSSVSAEMSKFGKALETSEAARDGTGRGRGRMFVACRYARC